MFRTSLAIEITVALFFTAPFAMAGPSHRYTVAPGSEVSARVAFFGIASKTARFPKVSGSVTLTPGRPEAIDLDITIDAAALTAGDPTTLRRLKGPAFFDIARHPTVTFRGETMTTTGPRNAAVRGQLTARGVTRPTVLNVTFAADPAQLTGGEPIALSGRAVIDRRVFGMTAYSGIVGRKVTITLDAWMQPA
ncbi:YceI family protein [Novosphingobium flavum]|uniref:YceI family protein n=1 Tax=Novosphingobium flavum TaxID=1778672 RepID=A0A7X1FU20_9SPHN|nr:YceI family protein [Novosphingobium flavum]MBC2666976.1 YceI family protein [Novosphingobium flavum]